MLHQISNNEANYVMRLSWFKGNIFICCNLKPDNIINVADKKIEINYLISIVE